MKELYIEFIKIRFQSGMQYRSAFLWTSFAKAVRISIQFFLIWVMVRQFQTMAGWKAHEVMLLFALQFASYSLAGTFFMQPCDRLSRRIISGDFDEILTKPLNSFFHYIGRESSTGYVGNLLVSFVIIAICLTTLHIKITIVKVLFLLLTIYSGGLIIGAIFVITCVPAFWILNSRSLMRTSVSDIRVFTQYPLSIYHVSIQLLLTLVIPYGFVNFYPAQFFLGKHDGLLFHPIFQFLPPLIGTGLMLLAYRVWHVGVNQYQSSGS